MPNIAFIGAPEANTRLPTSPPFSISVQSTYEKPRFGTGGIVNLHPAPGEESIYFGSGRPFTFDYAVMTLLPNLHPGHKVLILAGTNTYGCPAAADFITRPDLLPELYVRLGVPKGGKPLPDFEALIKVAISGGVPIHPQLVVVRTHTTAPAQK